MPSFSTMKTTIYDWINGQSLVNTNDIVYQYQNQPFANKPGFTLLLNSFLKIGRDDYLGPDDDGDIEIKGNREFTLVIQGFGAGIVEKTVQLRDSLERPDIYAALVTGGVIPYNFDDAIQDISGLDNSENEERSIFNVFMRTDNIITGVPVGLIEKVNIDATIEQPGKDDYLQTIEIDSTI